MGGTRHGDPEQARHRRYPQGLPARRSSVARYVARGRECRTRAQLTVASRTHHRHALAERLQWHHRRVRLLPSLWYVSRMLIPRTSVRWDSERCAVTGDARGPGADRCCLPRPPADAPNDRLHRLAVGEPGLRTVHHRRSPLGPRQLDLRVQEVRPVAPHARARAPI